MPQRDFKVAQRFEKGQTRYTARPCIYNAYGNPYVNTCKLYETYFKHIKYTNLIFTTLYMMLIKSKPTHPYEKQFIQYAIYHIFRPTILSIFQISYFYMC